MQTISATAAAILAEGTKLGVTIACSGVNGAKTLTAADIVRRSFYLDRNSSSGTSLELGNAEAAELGFLLENADGRFNRYIFEGATLTVDLVIGAETLRLGVFTVDNGPKRGKTIKIVALDNMAKFNRAYGTALTGTPTLGALAADCCTACGVTLNTTVFTNSTVAVTIPTEENITFHQVICWIAELAGTCAWIDSDGELNFSWYGENQGATVITLTSDNISRPEISESDIVITGVMIRDSDLETLAGADGYVLTIDSNPLVITANISTMLTAIGTKIVGNTYRPFSFDALAMPHVWPMDAVTIGLDDPIVTPADGMDIIAQASSADMETVVNGAGNDGADLFLATVPTPIGWVTNHRYTLNGMSRLAGRGETVTEAGYAGATPFTSVQRTDMVKLTKQVVEVMGLIANWIISGKISSADGSAWFDLDLPELVQQAVIGGKTVVFTIDPSVGIEITIDGAKMFGISTDGYVFANRLADPDDPLVYAQVGQVDATTSMFTLYRKTSSAYTEFRKRLQIFVGGTTATIIDVPVRSGTDTDGSATFILQHGDAELWLWGNPAGGGTTILKCGDANVRTHGTSGPTMYFTGGSMGVNAVAPYITGVQIFANNAAAIAGGLAVGDLYRNGADPDHLCIVH